MSLGSGLWVPVSLADLFETCPMWVMRSPRGSARWRRSCMKCWSCDHVGDNIGCWANGRVMVVIEMVVEE